MTTFERYPPRAHHGARGHRAFARRVLHAHGVRRHRRLRHARTPAIQVFVANLARRPDRRARMARMLPAVWDVEYTTRWPGPLDGEDITPAELRDVGLFSWQIESSNKWWNRPQTLGEVGRALSHLSIWRCAIELGGDVTVVLEDDVALCGDIDGALDHGLRDLAEIDPGWDLVHLGRWALDPARDTRVGGGIVRPGASYGAFGYALSAGGLAALLDVGFERDLIPVDELLVALSLPHPRRDVRRRYRPSLSTYAFDPPLVTQLADDRVRAAR